jgi:hypothetical protein
MQKRLLTMLLVVVAIAGFAGTSQAQYMFIDGMATGSRAPVTSCRRTGL